MVPEVPRCRQVAAACRGESMHGIQTAARRGAQATCAGPGLSRAVRPSSLLAARARHATSARHPDAMSQPCRLDATPMPTSAIRLRCRRQMQLQQGPPEMQMRAFRVASPAWYLTHGGSSSSWAMRQKVMAEYGVCHHLRARHAVGKGVLAKWKGVTALNCIASFNLGTPTDAGRHDSQAMRTESTSSRG